MRSIGIADAEGDPLKDATGAIVLDYEESMNRGGMRQVDGATLYNDLPEGPELPARVDGHGCLVWRYPDEQLEPIRGLTGVRGYAKVYRSVWVPKMKVKSRMALAAPD